MIITRPKLLADECTFGTTVRLMREMDFEVIRIQELGMSGSPDSKVYTKSQKLEAILITNDHGFADVLSSPPSTHNGIILLKMMPDPVVVQSVHKVLKSLLQNEVQYKGVLYIVDRNKYRKRLIP